MIRRLIALLAYVHVWRINDPAMGLECCGPDGHGDDGVGCENAALNMLTRVDRSWYGIATCDTPSHLAIGVLVHKRCRAMGVKPFPCWSIHAGNATRVETNA